uniref:Uncharacterized protein n=1 Tax=Romanomermis culicivorax TaxID=13658 RepID=A0A915L8S8_ROMCU
MTVPDANLLLQNGKKIVCLHTNSNNKSHASQSPWAEALVVTANTYLTVASIWSYEMRCNMIFYKLDQISSNLETAFCYDTLIECRKVTFDGKYVVQVDPHRRIVNAVASHCHIVSQTLVGLNDQQFLLGRSSGEYDLLVTLQNFRNVFNGHILEFRAVDYAGLDHFRIGSTSSSGMCKRSATSSAVSAVKMPTLLAMACAVIGWSPVTMI